MNRTAQAEAAEVQTQTDKIIYQYKLLKKIRRRAPIALLYAGLPLVWLSAAYVWDGLVPVAFSVLALGLWQAVYCVVTKLLLARENESGADTSRYGWSRSWPWYGYLPTATISFRQFRSIQLHLFVVGFLISGVFAVWLPPVSAASLAVLHSWWMLPRILLISSLQRSAASGSLLTLGASDASLYAP
ncbi:hypothetical protein [Paenibacillus sp.]|uniref:hypothetical protein n=1 Tax=Paenibacillus sp. TaxID=58172 RepID=UPI002D4970FE|nr:hypothetical protein [Paenibacillus sp.]HZG87529.1 hypothetical protein [Paenibacillus sp.]